jgi:hypothetical protein
MQRREFASILVAILALFLASTTWADVPAPPVNQTLGFPDVATGSLTEADCRVCHDAGVPDQHHVLYGEDVPPGSDAPFPGAGDGIYVCLTCHDENFTVVRDCLACHTTSPHHTTADALAGDCKVCHGDIVDNMDDGHYIPTYSPSLVTPTRSQGDGEPLNSRGNGAGACDYCHDDDGLSPPVILTNQALHHGTGLLSVPGTCDWCHDFGAPFEEQIRTCEGCHGPDSLHNIQADSPNVDNPGTIVVGGEDAGYGHVGRDGGAGDSDCWGCHGFAQAYAPGSGPVVPTVYAADQAVIDAGADTAVTLTGASFTNITGPNQYVSNVALTDGDGAAVTLTPDLVDQGSLTVTVPGETAPGNYKLQAVKQNAAGEDVVSNRAAIIVKPQVTITEAAGDRMVTITGSGFGGYAEGSGTAVIGTVTTRTGKKTKTRTVNASIVSWSETAIEADFGIGTSPSEVTVNSVFGSDSSQVNSTRNGSGKKRKK